MDLSIVLAVDYFIRWVFIFVSSIKKIRFYVLILYMCDDYDRVIFLLLSFNWYITQSNQSQ